VTVPAVLAVLLIVFGAFATFQTIRTREAATAAPEWQPFVEAGRAAALALTTINHQTADQDVQRVLDLSTGAFYDDFQNRAEPFKQTVREAQSASQGTITEAGLETLDGDKAKVLVSVTVKTTNANAPNQEPRSWRMRISLQKSGDTYKASNIEFVP
jgi:Mce-associated membrane protein